VSSNLEELEQMVVQHIFCWTAIPYTPVDMMVCQLSDDQEKVGVTSEGFSGGARKKSVEEVFLNRFLGIMSMR
jgi:hypothetical protein